VTNTFDLAHISNISPAMCSSNDGESCRNVVCVPAVSVACYNSFVMYKFNFICRSSAVGLLMLLIVTVVVCFMVDMCHCSLSPCVLTTVNFIIAFCSQLILC